VRQEADDQSPLPRRVCRKDYRSAGRPTGGSPPAAPLLVVHRSFPPGRRHTVRECSLTEPGNCSVFASAVGGFSGSGGSAENDGQEIATEFVRRPWKVLENSILLSVQTPLQVT